MAALTSPAVSPAVPPLLALWRKCCPMAWEIWQYSMVPHITRAYGQRGEEYSIDGDMLALEMAG